MWGTPRASRTIVAGAPMGAWRLPEVFGSGRHANQYAAATMSTAKTAMLTLTARIMRGCTGRLYFARTNKRPYFIELIEWVIDLLS